MTEKSLQRAGVIGWPIGHSRSPLIHNHWISEHGLNARYEPLPVDPADAADWFETFAEHGLVGANVTIPHKETAFAACKRLDPQAQRLGAVNTLWLEGETLCGTSTDGAGFMAHLKAAAPAWQAHPKARSALVLGAGGAARAIVDALCDAGVKEVHIANRTAKRAQEVADHFAGHHCAAKLSALSLDAVPKVLGKVGLLVNTTSMGMTGQTPLDLSLEPLTPAATVYDIVYTPLETPLLAEARARGHTPVDGLGMLLHQAVPGFARWFGVTPTVTDALRQIVIDDLNR